MAPEAPGNLIVLDLSFREETVVSKVEQIVPPQKGPVMEWLRVRFHEAPEPGFYSVGNGVALARAPKRFRHSKAAEEVEIPTTGNLRYCWTNAAQGDGLMLVLVLPAGYTLDLDVCQPLPRSAKEFHGRLAVYFKPEGGHGQSVSVAWGIQKLQGEPKIEAERIRNATVRIGNTASNAGVLVDKEGFEPGNRPLSGMAYAVIALVAVVIGVGLLFFYVYQVPRLIPSAVQNQVFYILLILWGLASAAFLFGVMRSYARFTYRHLGIALEMGGSVVLFCLVVVGGFRLVPPASETFDLAVRAHSADTPLITSGEITLELPGLPHASIGQDGEANFKGLSAKLRGKPIRVLPKVDGYDEKWLTPTADENILTVELERAHPTFVQKATLVPPLKGKTVQIRVDGQKIDVIPDELGGFAFTANGKAGDRVLVEIFVNRELASSKYYVLSVRPIDLYYGTSAPKAKQ
jgi:hypothetical protein